jgi:LysM repeat protein
VKPGETIYGIAREYGIPYRDILKLNGLTDVSARRIREGTQLRLVGDAGQTPPVDTDRDFNVTDKTRDEISRRSKPGARLVSLDFNDARSPHAKGIEIVIPDNATQEERSAAEAYVKGVQAFFRHHGLERDIRGVHVRSDVGRGIPGIIHTEPFFLKDKAALRAIQKDPEGYIKVLADTLGTIDGVTFMPPHKRNDPGASQGSLNERDFAKRTLIPLLKKMALA